MHPESNYKSDPLSPRFRAPVQRPPEKANSYQTDRNTSHCPPAPCGRQLKKISFSRAWVLGCLVCGLWQGGATAALVTYFDQAAFNLAVSGQVEITFNSFNGFYASPLGISAPGSQISASATGGLFSGAAGTEQTMSTNNPVPLTFTFTGTLPTAVGGLFMNTDSNFNDVGSAIMLTLGDGSFLNIALSTSNTAGTFVGFTNDLGIASLTITSLVSPGAPVNMYPTVNTLYLGSAVPEPTSMFLSMIAGGMMLLRRKR